MGNVVWRDPCTLEIGVRASKDGALGTDSIVVVEKVVAVELSRAQCNICASVWHAENNVLREKVLGSDKGLSPWAADRCRRDVYYLLDSGLVGELCVRSLDFDHVVKVVDEKEESFVARNALFKAIIACVV